MHNYTDFDEIPWGDLNAETQFDVCEAWYLFARDYHGGQGSELYAILSKLIKMDFRPAPSLEPEKLTENSRELYDALVARWENSQISHGLELIRPVGK